MNWTIPALNVCWAFGGILGLLSLATLGIYGIPTLRSSADRQELRQRIQSWWIIVLFFGAALGGNRAISVMLFGFVSFLALKEYLSLIPTRKSDRRILFWAYLAVVLQYSWVYAAWYGMFLVFIPVYMLLFLPLRMVMQGETQGFLKAIGTLHWGLMLTVFSLSHIAYLQVLPVAGNPVAGGAGLLLYLVFLTEINDIAQYCWGKTLGHHQVVPTVSPNKTWEGLIGGVLTTIGLAVGTAPWLTPFSLVHSLAIGLLIGLAGFVGDVTISALKRDLGIKDSGSMLPGHGGILDRLDSLTYTAPLFFHFTVYFYFSGIL